jgi:hypothetical protein
MSLKVLISMTKSLCVRGFPGASLNSGRSRHEPGGLFAFKASRCRFNEIAAHLVPHPWARRCSMTEWYFVWVEGLRGPVPQKWSSDGLWGQVGRQDVIVRFTLSDAEAHLPLDELARRHPVPDGR